MHFAQYDGQVYPQRWASLPILMGKVAQRLGQIDSELLMSNVRFFVTKYICVILL